MINECKYSGLHLGGGRKPDGIIYTQKYGVIIDTKAYSGGYNLPISQSDENILIENGILKNYLVDYKNSKIMNKYIYTMLNVTMVSLNLF